MIVGPPGGGTGYAPRGGMGGGMKGSTRSPRPSSPYIRESTAEGCVPLKGG